MALDNTRHISAVRERANLDFTEVKTRQGRKLKIFLNQTCEGKMEEWKNYDIYTCWIVWKDHQ